MVVVQEEGGATRVRDDERKAEAHTRRPAGWMRESKETTTESYTRSSSDCIYRDDQRHPKRDFEFNSKAWMKEAAENSGTRQRDARSFQRSLLGAAQEKTEDTKGGGGTSVEQRERTSKAGKGVGLFKSSKLV